MKKAKHYEIHSSRVVLEVMLVAILGIGSIALVLGLLVWTLHDVREVGEASDEIEARINDFSERSVALRAEGHRELEYILDENDSEHQVKADASDETWLTGLAVLLNERLDLGDSNYGQVDQSEVLRDLKELERIRHACIQWRNRFNRAKASKVTSEKASSGILGELSAELDSQIGRQRLHAILHNREHHTSAHAEHSEDTDSCPSLGINLDAAKTEIADLKLATLRMYQGADLDELSDIRDNVLTSILNRLRRVLVSASAGDEAVLLRLSGIVNRAEESLFGKGFEYDRKHQTVRLGEGGGYAATHEYLTLMNDRKNLRTDVTDRLQSSALAYQKYLASLEVVEADIAEHAEETLESSAKTVNRFGAGVSALFVILVLMIAKHVHRDIKTLKNANTELERARSEIQSANEDLHELLESRKSLEMQLVHAQKMESIGQLAAGIAHEINTPTQYVGDNTRFIRDGTKDLLALIDSFTVLMDPTAAPMSWQERNAEIDRQCKEADVEFLKEEIPIAIEQTLEGVDRVSDIIKSMKDFSHPGGEEKTPIDLARAIESTATVCRNRWKYVAELETDFQEPLPFVPAFVGEFNQVILNLIVNAADAIAEKVGNSKDVKGLIRISTRLANAFAEIRITDNGGGIPEDVKHKVFDPFFTTKEVGKGTGQGLAISHDVIVNKHGGTLTVESEPGVGTTFIIMMPILVDETEKEQAA